MRAWSLIDEEDFDLVSDRSWSLHSGGYAIASRQRDGVIEHLKMHRVILGLKKGNPLVADHINHDRLDNRRSNLRAIEQWENSKNRRSLAKSRFRGVTFDRVNNVWMAWRYEGSKTIFIGRYQFEVEAAYAVMLSRIERLLDRFEAAA